VSLVRTLAPADEAEWRKLWRAYLDFYDAAVSEAVSRETWRRLLDAREPVHGLAAEIDGRMVGIVHYIFHKATWSIADRCYLADLFVAPEARRAGVGRALIEAVYRAADAAGAELVYWLTAESNTPARRLYDRIGKLTPFIEYRR
jgi:GNAT superfamily N-acetyltransferase